MNPASDADDRARVREKRPGVKRLAVVLLLGLAVVPRASAQCVPANCDDGNACTTDACDPSTGACTHAPVMCNDNDVCTSDACDPAVGCTFRRVFDCDDGDACTTDTCDPSSGLCRHVPVICNDNDVCTSDACDPVLGVCTFTRTVVCDDGNPCTTDVCNAATGQCEFVDINCVDPSQLTVKATGVESALSFKRKTSGQDGALEITVTNLVTSSDDGPPQKHKLRLKAVVTGPDARLASLVYPIAALSIGTGARDAMHDQGYDFSVIDASPPCQNLLPAATCTVLAAQLSKSIDASLALERPTERDAFRRAASAFGVPSDVCASVP